MRISAARETVFDLFIATLYRERPWRGGEGEGRRRRDGNVRHVIYPEISMHDRSQARSFGDTIFPPPPPLSCPCKRKFILRWNKRWLAGNRVSRSIQFEFELELEAPSSSFARVPGALTCTWLEPCARLNSELELELAIDLRVIPHPIWIYECEWDGEGRGKDTFISHLVRDREKEKYRNSWSRARTVSDLKKPSGERVANCTAPPSELRWE